MLCKNLHACFANRESLNIVRSLKPTLPTIFDLGSSSHLIQWIFMLSPRCPYQNFQITVSISLHKPLGSLKHPIVNVGITWITNLIKTSCLNCDNNFPSHPCNFFHSFFDVIKAFFFSFLPIKNDRPRYFSNGVISYKPKLPLMAWRTFSGVDLLKNKVVLLLLTLCPDASSYVSKILNTFAHSSVVALQKRKKKKRLLSTNKSWVSSEPLLHKEKPLISPKFLAFVIRLCNPSVQRRKRKGDKGFPLMDTSSRMYHHFWLAIDKNRV